MRKSDQPNKLSEQFRLERDRLQEELERVKSNSALAKNSGELEAQIAASSRLVAELREKTAQLEAERNLLRTQLKDKAGAVAVGSHDLELKMMSQKVHAAGMEIMRLKQELGKARLHDNAKVNGMLNHLRSLIDPFD